MLIGKLSSGEGGFTFRIQESGFRVGRRISANFIYNYILEYNCSVYIPLYKNNSHKKGE